MYKTSSGPENTYVHFLPFLYQEGQSWEQKLCQPGENETAMFIWPPCSLDKYVVQGTHL